MNPPRTHDEAQNTRKQRMNLQEMVTRAGRSLGALRKQNAPQSWPRLDLLVVRLVIGSSANVLAEGTKQVYLLTPLLWPLEPLSTHHQSPLSRSRVTVAVWGSGVNARRPACGSQLHTRPTCARSVSRTGRLLRSSTHSPNANPRENNKTAAGGPGRVLIVSARTIGETKNPVADAQTFSPTTCKLAALYILD